MSNQTEQNPTAPLVRLVLEMTPEVAENLHWSLSFVTDEGPSYAGWRSKELTWLLNSFEKAIALQKQNKNPSHPSNPS